MVLSFFFFSSFFFSKRERENNKKKKRECTPPQNQRQQLKRMLTRFKKVERFINLETTWHTSINRIYNDRVWQLFFFF